MQHLVFLQAHEISSVLAQDRSSKAIPACGILFLSSVNNKWVNFSSASKIHGFSGCKTPNL